MFVNDFDICREYIFSDTFRSVMAEKRERGRKRKREGEREREREGEREKIVKWRP